ncbi:MAG: ABC transporter permease [Verrucomicrobiae bacterium]|nr:ABC transporter permease [Verrucomicrobiae bacterium]
MNLLLSALTIGLILSLLALGVYISFRIFDFADITADGSITLGAAVAAVLITHHVHPLWATLAGALSGGFAGAATALLHVRFRIHPLLSGILVMTALYSMNLHIMGRSNIPLISERTLASVAEQWIGTCRGGSPFINFLGWEIPIRDAAMLAAMFGMITLAGIVLDLFFRTHLGTAMRATGDNAQMMRALGVDTGRMIIIGLIISNSLIALSGALLAQYQGFTDVQMGIGMVVWGLASVIMGESLVRSRQLGLAIMGAIMGSVLFRLLVAIALRWGLNPNDLKLITALFVFAALTSPRLLAWIEKRRRAAKQLN